jgi:hypothetical protein
VSDDERSARRRARIYGFLIVSHYAPLRDPAPKRALSLEDVRASRRL